jgi:hypothetical protein
MNRIFWTAFSPEKKRVFLEEFAGWARDSPEPEACLVGVGLVFFDPDKLAA